ncbi:MAG: helix-turn-helix domain-containing protein [Candidatus Woesearchaeota archaeon]|nr:helix-turn-helix domain-containing protein [Candidatus Woesearchaeota archaeon]
MKKDYPMISFVLRGRRRHAVMRALTEAKTPKQIAQECKISTSNVSNALAELKEKKLVHCITEDAHFFRFYELTKKGKDLLKQL